MGIITKARNQGQVCVYWKKKGQDRYGDDEYEQPEELDVRWDDMVMVVVNAEGKQLMSKAQVMVDRDMGEGDRLKYCALNELSKDDPVEEGDTYKVIAFEAIPNLKNRETFRRAFL